MAREMKSLAVESYITGKDLRIMRIHAKYTTGYMADLLSIKSRKTIENWEQGASVPGINQFFAYCFATGFRPHAVIREVLKRNQEDATQARYFDMESCLAPKKKSSSEKPE